MSESNIILTEHVERYGIRRVAPAHFVLEGTRVVSMVVFRYVQDPENRTVIGVLYEGVQLLVGGMNRDVIFCERVVEYVGWIRRKIADNVDRRTLFHGMAVRALDPNERCNCKIRTHA